MFFMDVFIPLSKLIIVSNDSILVVNIGFAFLITLLLALGLSLLLRIALFLTLLIVLCWTYHHQHFHHHYYHRQCQRHQDDNGLTHWGRATYICVSKLTIIGSDNGLSPNRRKAISWTNGGILLIRSLETNFSAILSEIYIFFNQENSLENVVWKMASILSRPQCVKCDLAF